MSTWRLWGFTGGCSVFFKRLVSQVRTCPSLQYRVSCHGRKMEQLARRARPAHSKSPNISEASMSSLYLSHVATQSRQNPQAPGACILKSNTTRSSRPEDLPKRTPKPLKPRKIQAPRQNPQTLTSASRISRNPDRHRI